MQITLNRLLEDACPSIRFRLRREILGEDPSTPTMQQLLREVVEQSLVQQALSWQEPDGWFVGNGKRNLSSLHNRHGMEVAFRLLREAGLPTSHPAFIAGITALDQMDPAWREFRQDGVGGSWTTIEAIIRLLGGEEESAYIRHEAECAVAAFRFVTEVDDINQLIGTGSTRVFRKGSDWPGVYHLELLANTTSWRNANNLAIVAAAIPRMMRFYPEPDTVKARCRNAKGGEGVYGVVWLRITPQLPAPDGVWHSWFRYMEQFARMGVVARCSMLLRQVQDLRALLEKSDGWFRMDVPSKSFVTWDTYTGLALEPAAGNSDSWRLPEGLMYDLTFRSLLILHYAGIH